MAALIVTARDEAWFVGNDLTFSGADEIDEAMTGAHQCGGGCRLLLSA